MSYFTPTALSEALEIVAQGPGQIVAGGTDVYPSQRQGQFPPYYLDITRIAGFSQITHRPEGTQIGAAVTWSDVVSAKLPSAFDGLKEAALEVGSIQIQNAGTVIGNICNASPAADGVPALLALDAGVQIESASRGGRHVPLASFIKGVRQKDLADDEIVSGITIPPQPDAMLSAFEKLGSRQYLVISICMTAANLVLDRQGNIQTAKIAVGACSAIAQRLSALEDDLIGCHPRDTAVEDHHLAPLSPIDDVRGSAAYRLDVVRAQVHRAIQKASLS